jgi:branched-subunit amino acid transport protein
MNVWIAVVLVGAGSYALRALPLFSARCRSLSAHTTATLERAGFASLAALAAGAARHQTMGVPSSAALAGGAALLVGGAVALRGRPLYVVAASGVGVHLVATALLTLR